MATLRSTLACRQGLPGCVGSHCVEQITGLQFVDFRQAAQPSTRLLIIAKCVTHAFTIRARDLASLALAVRPNDGSEVISPAGPGPGMAVVSRGTGGTLICLK